MPELPEVETVRRGLVPVMEGAVIARVELRRPNLRFPFSERFVERVTGARVSALSRRAKYLQADLSTGDVLVMHLGMSGSFRVDAEIQGEFHHPRSKIEAHDHVVFDMETGARVTYNDPRRFGFMLLVPRAELASHPLFRDVGIEPLGNELSGALLARLFAGKAAPLKAALLDQKLVAGLGNIYVCEALWRTGLDPTRPAGDIVRADGSPKPVAGRLAQAIRDVLGEAIAAGGSSLRDHTQINGELGYFQHSFAVYEREGEPCAKPGCGGTIARIVQSNRSTFYCPKCQRRV